MLAIASQQQSPAESKPTVLLEKAKNLEAKGDYLRAQGIYETLLSRNKLEKQNPSIRRAYEALKMKIIFSSIPTPDSLLYEVVPGDTLYDIAEKSGTTPELLKRSNGISKEGKIYPGMRLKVMKGKFSALIEKKRNRLTLLADGKKVKQYRVATGEKGSTPAGTFKIVNKLENPTWFHAGVVLPPDSPDNILGTRWMGFDSPGYGIHGTTLPQTIGTQSSKGCIRMLNSEAEELYDLLPVGTRVVVQE